MNGLHISYSDIKLLLTFSRKEICLLKSNYNDILYGTTVPVSCSCLCHSLSGRIGKVVASHADVTSSIPG